MNYRQLIINGVIAFCLVITFVSCHDNKISSTNNLEIALNQSGTNRTELEKVLEYYSKDAKDSLKLRAAKFLIENMTYHQSIVGEYIENFCLKVDSLLVNKSNAAKMMQYILPSKIDTLRQKIEFKHDITEIKADFLIKNIENSFEIWENSNYSPTITFDDFCEYLLPYKLKQEPLKLWKDVTSNDNYSKKIENQDFNLELYSKYIDLLYWGLLKVKIFPDSLEYKYDSEDNAYGETYIMRSMGIPAVVDFIPIPSDYNHWISIINHKYINNYKYLNDRAKSFTTKLSNTPKVFRKTYSINNTPQDSCNTIPAFINDKYNKDVTDFYRNVTSVEYNFGKVPENVTYGYLSFFDNFSWVEVAWDKLKKGKAVFQKMGREMVYIPTYYDKEKKICAKYPIILDDVGNVKEIKPNKSVTNHLTLSNLFPQSIDGEINGKKLLNANLLACNNIETDKLDSIAKITHYKTMKFDTLNTNCRHKYKTWVIKTDTYNNICVGDFQFFDEDNQQLIGQSFAIYREKVVSNDNIALLFDNNIFTSANINSEVGVIFKEPKAVKYFKYITAVDGSGIYPDNEYELFYFDEGEWVSLGRKMATTDLVEYDNVPTDALLWLHNHTKVQKERPFMVKNGKIRFW